MNDDKHSQKSGVSLISVCIPTTQYFVCIQGHKVRLYNANTLNHIDAISILCYYLELAEGLTLDADRTRKMVL